MNKWRVAMLVGLAIMATLISGCSSDPRTVEEFETKTVAKARSEALTRIAGIEAEPLAGSKVVTDELSDECQLALSNQQGYDDVHEQYRCVAIRQVTFGAEQAGWLSEADISNVTEEFFRLNTLEPHDPDSTDYGSLTAEVVIRGPEEPSFLGLLETPFHDQDGSRILSNKRTVDWEFLEAVSTGGAPVVVLTLQQRYFDSDADLDD